MCKIHWGHKVDIFFDTIVNITMEYMPYLPNIIWFILCVLQ